MKWNAKTLAKLQTIKKPTQHKIFQHWKNCNVKYIVDGESKYKFKDATQLSQDTVYQDDFDFKFKLIVPQKQNTTILLHAEFNFNHYMNRIITKILLEGFTYPQSINKQT